MRIETPADKIALSIVGLRNARAGLMSGLKVHDKSAVKARIDVFDEMISRVSDIDRNLKQLSLDARRNSTDELCHLNDLGRGGTAYGGSSPPNDS